MSRQNRGKSITTDRNEPHSIAVFGGGEEGRIIAERLAESDYVVFFYDENPGILRRTDDEVSTGQVVLDDVDSLACTSASEVSVVVVAGRTDRRNFLLAQLLRTSIGVENIVFRVNEAANVDAFASLGLETVTPADDIPAEMCAAVDRAFQQRTSA